MECKRESECESCVVLCDYVLQEMEMLVSVPSLPGSVPPPTPPPRGEEEEKEESSEEEERASSTSNMTD